MPFSILCPIVVPKIEVFWQLVSNKRAVTETDNQTAILCHYAILKLHCVSKKLHPFHFCDNFVGHEPMLIFGKNVAKEIGNMQRLTLLLLTVQNVLGLRTSLSVASVAENMWCSTLKIAF